MTPPKAPATLLHQGRIHVKKKGVSRFEKVPQQNNTYFLDANVSCSKALPQFSYIHLCSRVQTNTQSLLHLEKDILHIKPRSDKKESKDASAFKEMYSMVQETAIRQILPPFTQGLMTTELKPRHVTRYTEILRCQMMHKGQHSQNIRVPHRHPLALTINSSS